MLKEKILRKLDSEGKGFSEKIAKIAGYSSSSALRKVLKDPNKEFGKFDGLLKIVQELFPDEVIEMMKEYSLVIDPNKYNARCMVVWLESNKIQEEKRKLIERMKKCTNTASRTCAEIYHIHDQYFQSKINLIDAINLYGKINIKCNEESVAVKLCQAYIHQANQNYPMMYQTLIGVEEEIEQIKEEYIKDIFLSKTCILKASENIRRNNVHEARKICQFVLDNSNDTLCKGWICMHMGNSFLLEDFDKAVEYFELGLSIAKSWHVTLIDNLKRSITFACNLWSRESTHFHLNLKSNHSSDIHEIAFYYIRFKQFIKATNELDKVDFEKLNNNQKAFHMFYRGLISNKMEDFAKSIVYFKKSGDSFFRQMPILELKKIGVDDCLLEALAS